jgi:type 2 lantibiotic biosynthesis protein LanM
MIIEHVKNDKTAVREFIAQEIATNATFWFEKVIANRIFSDKNGLFNNSELSKQIEEWCKITTDGNWEKFSKHLAWSELTIESATELLESKTLLTPSSLPSWGNTLIDIMQTASSFKAQDISPSPIDPNTPYPFEDVLLPLTFVARRKLLKNLEATSVSDENSLLNRFSESAYLGLERALMGRLFNIMAKTLEHEFSHSRPLGKSLLSLVINKQRSTKSKAQYNAFIENLLSDGLVEFLSKYPVLARFLAITIDLWINAAQELIERLDSDFTEIQKRFNTSEQPLTQDQVIEIKSGLGDLHNQNRSVTCLTFKSGLKLIYKPKNLGLETAFGELLEYLNKAILEFELSTNRQPLTLKSLKVLSRDHYGWIEYVNQQSCTDDTQAKHFYVRAGMISCLLYALGATDCHNENLIAHGEHLILIDMETVMQHRAKPMSGFTDKSSNTLANQQLQDSILGTGLLPMWQLGLDNSVASDFSGLGSVEAQSVPVSMPIWKFINTDDMYQGYEKMDRPVEANVPKLNEVALSPNDYTDDLIIGFQKMYRLLMQQRDRLLTSNSPLLAFANQQVRFIFRPTKVYGMLFQKIMTPECLRNGITWSIEADILSKPLLEETEKPQAWNILSSEMQAIAQLDVPYFNATAGSSDLILNEITCIKDYFEESCLLQVQKRLKNLDEANLAQQTEIIQLAFYARQARTLQTNTGKSSSGEMIEYNCSILTNDELVAKAIDIAQEINNRAIHSQDDNDSITWINLTYVPKAERFQLMPISYSLYDGSCGIALFLAALTKITNDEYFQDITLKCLFPLRKALKESNQASLEGFARDLGIGGATGLPSIIYALVKISKLLSLPVLQVEAQQISWLITDELIAADRTFDVVGGAAGGILSLLTLYESLPDPYILQRAIACGQHLLTYYQPILFNKTSTSKLLTGFSHGATGIAYALMRLYAVTQDATYLDTAHAMIDYENQLFYPEHGNWREITPFYEPSAPPVFWSTWCHGAPGIALGRLGCLSINPSEQIQSDVAIALQTTHQTSFQEIDQICCGNLGRMEAMLVAGAKLNNPRYQQNAQELATQVCNRVSKVGAYSLLGNLPKSIFSPCFFQGTAGIGYHLLRLAYPHILPSVLLWE